MRDLPELPASVVGLIEFSPVEDIAVRILRDAMPDVPTFTLIPEDADEPFFFVVRRRPSLGNWDGDPRFSDEARILLQTFSQDPDGDEKCAWVGEAARVAFRNAWLDHSNYPGLGSIIRIEQLSEASRKTDWATSTGPVQYADLPTGYWRYESEFTFWVRKA